MNLDRGPVVRLAVSVPGPGRFALLVPGLRAQVQAQAEVLAVAWARNSERVVGVDLSLLAVEVVVGSGVIGEVVVGVSRAVGIEGVVVEDQRRKVICM